MCEKCSEIDNKICHYRDIASRVVDLQTLDGIESLVAELEQQKLAFRCEPEN
jgi:hypothetical protein